jgi:hypothetical protein
MRGLSGWFNQVSTDSIKKTRRVSNCLAGFSVPHLPVREIRTGSARYDRQVCPIFELRFSTIHFQRSTHPQISIYMDIFQFTRELMEIESISMDSSAGR